MKRRSVGGAREIAKMRRQGKGLLDFGKKLFNIGKKALEIVRPSGIVSRLASQLPGVGPAAGAFLKSQGYGRPRRRRGGAMYRAQVIPSLRM